MRGRSKTNKQSTTKAVWVALAILCIMPLHTLAAGQCLAPAWYEQPTLIAPSKAYYGIGRGPSISDAKAQALSELSKTLSVSVSSQVIVRSKNSDSSLGESVNQTELEEAIANVSNLTLRGIKTDKSVVICGQTYVLVTISKKEADRQVLTQDKLMENIKLALEGRLNEVSSSLKIVDKKVDRLVADHQSLQETIKMAQDTIASLDSTKEEQRRRIEALEGTLELIRSQGNPNGGLDENMEREREATTSFVQGSNIENSDPKQAKTLYLRSAELGNASAMLALGLLFSKGHDYSNSAKWFKMAAERGNAGSYFFLGSAYEMGHGVDRDYQEALQWYQRAASFGDSDAVASITELKRSGNLRKTKSQVRADQLIADISALKWKKGPINCSKMRKLTIRAANLGNAEAMFELAHSYRLGRMLPPCREEHLEANTEKALGWFVRAAKQNNTDAIGWLCSIFSGNEPRDFKKSPNWPDAIKWCTTGAAQGDAGAQLTLGEAYWSGTGVQRDYRKAVSLFEKAALSEEGGGLPDANYWLSEAYSNGKGVKKDPARAESFLLRAFEESPTDGKVWKKILELATNGSPSAQLALGTYFKNSYERFNENLRNEDDLKNAKIWLERAVKQGNQPAREALLSLSRAKIRGRAPASND